MDASTLTLDYFEKKHCFSLDPIVSINTKIICVGVCSAKVDSGPETTWKMGSNRKTAVLLIEPELP